MASLIFRTTDARHSRWHFYSSITTGINGKNRRKHNDFYYLSQYNVRNSIVQSFLFFFAFFLSSRIVQMEQSTHKVSIFFPGGGFNVFMWRISCVCVLTVLHFFCPIIFLTCSRRSIQKPIIYTLTGCTR